MLQSLTRYMRAIRRLIGPGLPMRNMSWPSRSFCIIHFRCESSVCEVSPGTKICTRNLNLNYLQKWEMQHNKTNSKNTKVASCRLGRPWECCTREGLKTVLDLWFLAEDRFVAQWHVRHCIVCCIVTSYHYCLLYPYISFSKDIYWLHKLQWPQIHCTCIVFHGML